MGSAAETAITITITITELAGERMSSLLRDRGAEDRPLRVFVAGGNCSGYQYGMEIAEAEKPGDTLLTVGGLKLLVDEESAPVLDGAEIDFEEDVMRSGFTITNPSAPAKECCGGHGHEAGEAAGCC
jgi:iron-sulfur cluster assembly protein